MEGKFFWAEILRTFYLQVGLHVDQILRQNIVIRVFSWHHAIDKTPVNWLQLRMETL